MRRQCEEGQGPLPTRCFLHEPVPAWRPSDGGDGTAPHRTGCVPGLRLERKTGRRREQSALQTWEKPKWRRVELRKAD